MAFTISKAPQVDVRLRTLAKRAAALGISAAFTSAMKRIVDHLKTNPLAWGDPEYNLKHEGAIACHGIEESLLVHFAVYQAEQVVCITRIEPLSDSPLFGV